MCNAQCPGCCVQCVWMQCNRAIFTGLRGMVTCDRTTDGLENRDIFSHGRFCNPKARPYKTSADLDTFTGMMRTLCTYFALPLPILALIIRLGKAITSIRKDKRLPLLLLMHLLLPLQGPFLPAYI